MASNYDGNKGVNGNGLLYFIGKVKTWIDTYFLKKNLGSSKAGKVVVTDSSGNVDVSTISTTELGYLSGINQNIHTALVNKANQTDLTDIGNSFGTFANTTVPNTYQPKIKVGTADSGAVNTISAGENVNITINGTTATISSTDTKYTLPAASTTLGGVKLEKATSARGIQIDDATGIIGVSCGYSIGYDDTDGLLDVALYPEGGLAIMEPSQGKFGLAVVCGSSTYLDEGHIEVVQADDNRKGIVYLFNTDSEVANSSMAGLGAPSYSLFIEKLAGKANLASPTFSGTPKAPTAATSTNTTQIATTAFVHAAIENADIGGKTYQGNIASEAELKTFKTFKQGQYFTVSSAFTFADGSWALGIGDMLFVKENYTWASGNVDGSKFAAVQGNNDFLTNSELDAIFTEVFGSAA